MSKKLVITILENLEGQLLNGIASEDRKDILKTIKSELKEVQKGLSYMRKFKTLKT